MNWPAPDPLAPPPSPVRPRAETDSAQDVESATDRRGRSAVPAAAWLALLGASLLLVAAIAVVASNWNAIGRGFRVGGLLIVTGGLVVVSERLRGSVPTTASVIAHVATYLTASVAIAVPALFGFTWPGCLLAGGAVLVVATELQAGRWRRITMHLAQIVGFAMAAAGAAALLHTTAGVVSVITAAGLLAAGAQRRSVALAILAVLSPALTALAEAGIGGGTLARAGLVGERLGWSGPVVGLLAATIIGAIAVNRRNNPLMLVAAASPVIGIVTGLAATDGSGVAWWSVPALALLAAELGVWLLPTDRFRSQITELVDVGAGALAVVAWLSPALASIDLFDSDLAHPWAVPIATTALALLLTALRWRASDSALSDLGVAGIMAVCVAGLVAFDAAAVLLAAGAVLATLVGALLSRRLAALAIHPTALWALLLIAALHDEDGTGTGTVWFVLLAALLGIVLATRTRVAGANGPLGWAEMSGVAAGAALGALAITNGNEAAVGLASVSLVMLLVVLLDRRFTIWGIVIVAGTGVIALDAATADRALDSTYTLGWAAATAAFGILWAAHRSSLVSSAAAVSAVLALATAAPAFDVTAEDFTVMTMLAVTVLTGLAYTLDRRSPRDAAAVTAGLVLLTTTTFDIDPAWASGAWVLIGLQAVVGGATTQRRLVQWAGLAITAAGLLSWWFTSGLHEWFVEVIEPADITAGDVWLAAVSVAALVAGLTLRSTLTVNSWVAYGTALLIPGLWLTSAQLDREPVWAIPLLLTIGMAAAGTGAWHRLAAPLVGGTVLTGTGVFLATGADLTAIPTWVWLAVGGVALLGVAVLIERNGKPGAPDFHELVTRWS